MKHSCHGASLIESLIALSVFAVGSALTGVWLGASIEMDANASRTMAAVSAIADLRERMHANAPGVAAGDYDVPTFSSSGCVRGCAASSLAADDLLRFVRTLREHLGYSVGHSIRCEDSRFCHVRVMAHGHAIAAMSFQP